MLKAAPRYLTAVEAFRPFLDVLESVLVTPAELCTHWGYTEEHLCNLRRAGRGVPHIKLETGGVRYRASEIVASELRGTTGPLTLDRVCEALAACHTLTEEARAAAQSHVRAAFPSGG